MKIVLLSIVCFCASLLAFQTGAVSAAEGKIGVMNGQKIIWTCAAGVKAKSKLEGKMKEFQTKFKADEEALLELKNEIEKKSSAWSKEKKAEKVKEFTTKRQELQTKEEEAREEMNKLKESEIGPIIKAVQVVLEKFGKDHGYTVILDTASGAVPYFNKDAADVTDELVKEVDTNMAAK